MTRLAARVRRLPLRVRLALAGTLLLPVPLAVVFGLVFLRFEDGLNATIDGDLRARADAVAIMIGRQGPQALRAVPAQELLRPLGAFAQVVDRHGRVLSSTDAVAGVHLLSPEQAAAAATRGLRTDDDGIPYVAKRARLVARALPGRQAAIVIGRSLKDREGANESFGRALLIGGPLALLLSAAACYLASAAALRPVETMRRRAAEITGTGPSARLPVPATDDEIARLGQTLNDMIARLDDALSHQRELTQNASHELRTPLTVLTTEIELALQHDLDPAPREAIATALEEARRVARLADDLLTLAQVEERNLPLAIETVDLDEIVRSAAARAARAQRAAGRTIAVDSQTLITDADPTRIEQALDNLLDNALVHGQGTVTITMRHDTDRIHLTVTDEGPGFPDTLRATAFDRFTRASDRPRHGAGLGLAIVKAIAHAHGGHPRIGAHDPSSVTITLPPAHRREGECREGARPSIKPRSRSAATLYPNPLSSLLFAALPLGKDVAVRVTASAMVASERIERLATGLADAGLDAFVATSDESIAYLTGFRPLQLERLFAVVVRGDGVGAVVVPRLDEGQTEGVPSGLDRVAYDAASDGIPELLGTLHGVRAVGVEEDHIVFARSSALQAGGVEPAPAGAIIGGLRARKDASEVENVRAACGLVESALTQLFDELRPEAVEREVNARVESWLRERGATDAHPLILFGEDAANPHAQPGPRELRPGDVVCADLSACLDGYWGDLTRCATAGAASEWAQEAWEVVRRAQSAAIDACTPGTPARDVDAAQRRIVEGRPDLGECLHGAGHAIGLAIHEPPFLVPRTQAPLEEGMIFTIEPGLYLRGAGGVRLEDDVVVRASGPEILSSLAHDLLELEGS